MVKQVIILRKDLNMRKGKMVAQGAHASMKVFLDRIQWEYTKLDSPVGYMKKTGFSFNERDFGNENWLDITEWVEGSFTKICVSVNSEAELLALYEAAQAARLPCALVRDAGKTEFGGVPTYTAVAIGPASDVQVDKITGNLPLL